MSERLYEVTLVWRHRDPTTKRTGHFTSDYAVVATDARAAAERAARGLDMETVDQVRAIVKPSYGVVSFAWPRRTRYDKHDGRAPGQFIPVTV